MSQVINTQNSQDRLLPLRKKSLLEEQKIAKAVYIEKWQMGDATKTTLLERGIGLAVLPVVVCWSFLTLFLTIGLSLAFFVLRLFTFFCTNKNKSLAK